MAETSQNARYRQIAKNDRHGTEKHVQMSDNTGVLNHIAKFLGEGSITDGLIPVSDLMTSTGAGGSTQGMTVGGYGSLYGQVPRGTVDGANTRFHLDYNILEWWTWLQIGDRIQLPGVQGDPSNEPNGVMAVPGGEYQVELGRNYLTVEHPPQPGDEFYIWYVRADAAAVIANVKLTITSAYAMDPVGQQHGVFSIYGSGLPTFGKLPLKDVGASWSKTTDVFDVTSTLLPIQLTSIAGINALSLSLFTWEGDTAGAIFGISNGYNNYLDIYDVYLTVTAADQSVTIYRPTSHSFFTHQGTGHMLEDPPNYADSYALDTDPNTFARFKGVGWGNFAYPADAFVLSGFSPVSSTPGPTPVPLPTGNPVTVAGGGTTSLTPTDSGSPVIVTGSGASTVALPPVIAAPAAPVLSETPGGTLAATTYYAVVTYTNASGETIASAESTLAVAANNLLVVASPPAVAGATGWNAYVSSTSGAEVKQNFSSIPIGTSWTQPTSGLIAGTTAVPTVNSASPSATYTNEIINSGTSPLTIPVPSGATLNGGTTPVTLQPGQTAQVFFTPGTNNYTVAVTGGTTSGGTSPATPVLGSDGTPLVDPVSGEWIFPA